MSLRSKRVTGLQSHRTKINLVRRRLVNECMSPDPFSRTRLIAVFTLHYKYPPYTRDPSKQSTRRIINEIGTRLPTSAVGLAFRPAQDAHQRPLLTGYAVPYGNKLVIIVGSGSTIRRRIIRWRINKFNVWRAKRGRTELYTARRGDGCPAIAGGYFHLFAIGN